MYYNRALPYLVGSTLLSSRQARRFYKVSQSWRTANSISVVSWRGSELQNLSYNSMKSGVKKISGIIVVHCTITTSFRIRSMVNLSVKRPPVQRELKIIANIAYQMTIDYVHHPTIYYLILKYLFDKIIVHNTISDFTWIS